MARFVITDPSNQTQIFEISGSMANIGRTDSNDLMLRHARVSRSHSLRVKGKASPVEVYEVPWNGPGAEQR